MPNGPETFDKSFNRRFSKYPTLQALLLIPIPFGIGIATSFATGKFFGIGHPEAHQWVTMDYIATFLAILFWIGVTMALRNHLKQQNQMQK